MVTRLGGDPLAHRQADAALVAEVVHVADSLAELQVELGGGTSAVATPSSGADPWAAAPKDSSGSA